MRSEKSHGSLRAWLRSKRPALLALAGAVVALWLVAALNARWNAWLAESTFAGVLDTFQPGLAARLDRRRFVAQRLPALEDGCEAVLSGSIALRPDPEDDLSAVWRARWDEVSFDVGFLRTIRAGYAIDLWGIGSRAMRPEEQALFVLISGRVPCRRVAALLSR